MHLRWLKVRAGIVLAAASLGSPALLTAQETPRFTNLRVLTNREVALTLAATNGVHYRIDAATQLPAWAGLITVTGATPSLSITDAAAPYLQQRYYRAQQLGGSGVLTGDHIATTNGEIIIHPVRHASFVMSWQGKIIYNDPDSPTSLYTGLPKADLILLSHDHGDHFDAGAIEAVRGLATQIVAPLFLYTNTTAPQLSASHKAISIALTNGASTNVLGLTIAAVPAYNGNHPLGRGNGYVVTIGGKRLYMSGDTGDIPEMRALPDIDVAFVAINSFTMSVASAASAVREFRPKVVYPYHYSNTPTTDLNDFKRRVGQDLGIEVRLRKWYIDQ